MYYTYVLRSTKDGGWYTGATGNLRIRVKQRNDGRVDSTRSRRPLELVYYEACRNESDAWRRERFLKTGKGKRYLKQRLASWIQEES